MKANSLIENARIGVSNTDNIMTTTYGAYQSIIQANGAFFKNNYVGVLIMFKSKTMIAGQKATNKSLFKDCFFQNTSALKDPSYLYGLQKAQLDLKNVKGVNIEDCTFENTFYTAAPPSISNVNDYASLDLNIGIRAIDANYTISKPSNTFKNLWIGIDNYSTTDFVQNQAFVYLDFKSCVYGIVLRGGSGFGIGYSDFGMLESLSPRLDRNYIGINGRGNKVNVIKENIFSNGYCGIVTVDWGLKKGESSIFRNNFTDIGSNSGQGIYSYKANRYLQTRCNVFNVQNSTVQKHWANRGNMDRQGIYPCLDETSLPANTFIGNNPSLTDILMINDGWNSLFQYVVPDLTNTDYKPVLKRQTGTTIITLGNSYTPTCDLNVTAEACLSETLNRDIELILTDLDIALEDPEDTTTIGLIYEALKYYSENDSTGDSTIYFLNSLPLTQAKWMLLEYYLAYGHRDNAIDLFEILPVENYEQEITQQYYNVILNASQDERTIYDLNESEIETLTEIANSETSIAYNAQAIIHYLNSSGFEIPLPYVEEESDKPLIQSIKNNISANNIKLYPNPNQGILSINFGSGELAAKYEIHFFDLYGKIAKSVIISPNTSIFTIDISELSEGFYNCRILNGSEMIDSKKLIVLK
jgi:hypothetical protein